MRKIINWLFIVIVAPLILFAGSCSFQIPNRINIKTIDTFLRIKNDTSLLCSQEDFFTVYRPTGENSRIEIETNIPVSNVIALSDESQKKFQAAVWWESCKNRSYINSIETISEEGFNNIKKIYQPACEAYSVNSNGQLKPYYPNNSDKQTDLPSNLKNAEKIYYIPPLPKNFSYKVSNIGSLGNIKSGWLEMNPTITVNQAIEIPGDFWKKNYSAIKQINQMFCLEELFIPQTSTVAPYYKIIPPGLTSPITSNNFINLYLSTPYIDLSLVKNFNNLKNLFITKLQTQKTKDSIGDKTSVTHNNVPNNPGLEAMRDITSLQNFSLGSTDADNIFFLKHNQDLKSVFIENAPNIDDTNIFAFLPKLQKLTLKFIGKADLTNTAKVSTPATIDSIAFSNLRKLDLTGSPAESLTSLSVMTRLETANLSAGQCDPSGNPATILTPLQNISSCHLPFLDSLSPIKSLLSKNSLELFTISGRGLKDIDCESLQELKKEKSLNAKIFCTRDRFKEDKYKE